MKTIWIIGAGRFGQHAAGSLSKLKKDAHLVLVDPEEQNLPEAGTGRCTLEKMDGVDFLLTHLAGPENGPEWIIPAVPIHLAAEWCLGRMGSDRLERLTLLPAIDKILPNPMRLSDRNIYVSHADFKCPDNCPEPKDLCTVTRERRKTDMFNLLAKIDYQPFQSFVIRSHQLAPGVGGYRPDQLFTLLDQVRRHKGEMLVSTACRCHGVVSGFRRS